MTDTYIEKTMTDAFLTLNDFSGIPYIKFDGNGKPQNVAIENIPFNPPANGRWFALSFLPAEPVPAGLGENAMEIYRAVFQIDIFTPLGVGQAESNEKYEWLHKLFSRGKTFGDVTVLKCYRAMQEAETSFFRTVLRCNVTSTLPK
jgi:hypothetical protein